MVDLVVELTNEKATFQKAFASDVGYDLTCVSIDHKSDGRFMLDLGVKVQSPEGHYMELVPRSSFSKSGFVMANSLGIIDTDYRGNVFLPAIPCDTQSRSIGHTPHIDKARELFLHKKVAQLILKKKKDCKVHFGKVETNTERGEGGFGSTGK
jgi:dUTP pyrophosphatase